MNPSDQRRHMYQTVQDMNALIKQMETVKKKFNHDGFADHGGSEFVQQARLVMAQATDKLRHLRNTIHKRRKSKRDNSIVTAPQLATPDS